MSQKFAGRLNLKPTDFYCGNDFVPEVRQRQFRILIYSRDDSKWQLEIHRQQLLFFAELRTFLPILFPVHQRRHDDFRVFRILADTKTDTKGVKKGIAGLKRLCLSSQ